MQFTGRSYSFAYYTTDSAAEAHSKQKLVQKYAPNLVFNGATVFTMFQLVYEHPLIGEIEGKNFHL